MTMDVVVLTQRLIRTEGLSGEEGAMADLVEAVMTELGFREVTRDEYGTVVGRVGPPANRTALLFDGHMDVVPVTGEWSVDPFAGDIRDGRLYGRGATDMKGGLAGAICGVAAAAAEGKLTTEVAVSASVMEEVIEGVALGAVLDQLQPEMVVICEPSSLKVQVGQRGRIELLLTVTGRPAHAAHPQKGINPIGLASRALAALERLTLPKVEGFGEAILVPTDIVSDPYPSISMIPAAVKVRFDRRILPGETVEDVLGQMAEALREIDPAAFHLAVTADSVSTYTDRPIDRERFLPAWRIERDHTLVSVAERGLRAAGREPRLGIYGFCTNGSESAGRRGIPTIGLGPGAEEDAHTADESVALDELRAAAEVYKEMTLAIAGGAKP